MSNPPRTKRAKWRYRRLAETPPEGTKCCVHCLRFRPIAAFRYNYGERAVCLRCYEIKSAQREQRTAWRREHWRKNPENKQKAQRFVRRFVTKRKPWVMAFYKFRQLVDETLASGSDSTRAALKTEGVTSDSACRLCGSRENLHSFWPDYSKPQNILKYCAYHRRIESFGDTRTLDEQAAQAKVGRVEIKRIRKRIREARQSPAKDE